jgi:hypothetical protein
MFARSLRRLAALHQSSIDFDRLRAELIGRPLPLLYSHIAHDASDRLSASLASYVPQSWLPALSTCVECAYDYGTNARTYLIPSHHLVHFNSALPSSELLPDGTDPSHSPGEPFVRRMWAGGYVKFNPSHDLHFDSKAAVCAEGIRDVTIKGPPGREKIFVGLERRMFNRAQLQEVDLDDRDQWHSAIWPPNEDDLFGASIVERRNLVFMRERTPEELAEVRQQGGAVVPAKMLKRIYHLSVTEKDVV